MGKRTLSQLLTTFLYNANLSGFFQGRIWQGSSKALCVPGLNCYSCPGAIGACPLGALQSSLAGTIIGLPFYILGSLLVFGLLLGRRICGWFCPFGFIQELLYKLPTPKLKKNNVTRQLSKLKYVIGVVFVVLLPVAMYLATGVGAPYFCKLICPAGTLEAALPLILTNPGLRSGLGAIFVMKFTIMLLVVLGSIFLYRPFCRFLCPLGAWYSFFNRYSVFGIQVEEAGCTHCQACLQVCKMDCQAVGDRECINCGACQAACPQQVIHFRNIKERSCKHA